MKIHLFNPYSETTTFVVLSMCGKTVPREYITDKSRRLRPTCKVCRKHYFGKVK